MEREVDGIDSKSRTDRGICSVEPSSSTARDLVRSYKMPRCICKEKDVDACLSISLENSEPRGN